MANTPKGKRLIDEVSLRTDIERFGVFKKIRLFEEAKDDINVSKGSISKELRFIVQHMSKAFKDLNDEKQELEKKLREVEEELKAKSEAISINNYTPLCKPSTSKSLIKSRESYVNIVKKQQKEHVIVIEKATNEKINLENEISKLLKPIQNEIDMIGIKRRGDDKLIINLRNEVQKNTAINKLQGDARIKCKEPAAKIPSILIKEVDKNLKEEDILNELEEKEKINKKDAVIKVILSNKNFRTNQVVINLNQENTKRILDKNEVKMGFKIHPVELSVHVIQCRNCNKFGHFHKNKQTNEVICKAKLSCLHCDEEHMIHECRSQDNRDAARCVNCKGIHRSNYRQCPERLNKIEQILKNYHL